MLKKLLVCPSLKMSQLLCCNPNCENAVVVCSDKNCNCLKLHFKCDKISINYLRQQIYEPTYKKQDYYQQVVKITDQIIEKTLLNMRNMHNQFRRWKDDIKFSQNSKKFLNCIIERKFDNLKPKDIFLLKNELGLPKKLIFKDNKQIEIEKNYIQNLSNQLTNKISQFYISIQNDVKKQNGQNHLIESNQSKNDFSKFSEDNYVLDFINLVKDGEFTKIINSILKNLSSHQLRLRALETNQKMEKYQIVQNKSSNDLDLAGPKIILEQPLDIPNQMYTNVIKEFQMKLKKNQLDFSHLNQNIEKEIIELRKQIKNISDKLDTKQNNNIEAEIQYEGGLFKFSNIKNINKVKFKSLNMFTFEVEIMKKLDVQSLQIESQIGINYAGLTHFKPYFYNLKQLILINQCIASNGANQLSKLINLTSLILSNNKIGSSGFSFICKLYRLEKLYVDTNMIQDISGIHQLIRMKELNINNNKISAGSGLQLSKLTNLICLNFFGYWLQDHHKNTIKNVKKFDLNSKKLANYHIIIICLIYSNLTELDVRNNQINVLGAQSISRLVNLKSLNISQNKIGIDGYKFFQKPNKLQEINLFGRWIKGENGELISQIKKLDLQSLNFTDYHISAICYFLQNLTSLNLYNNQIKATGAKAIDKLINLKYLNLCGNEIGNEGLGYLKNLKNLEELDLFTNNITEAGSKSLSNFVNLRALNLEGNNIGIVGIKNLTSLKKLCKINLFGFQIKSDNGDTIDHITSMNFTDFKLQTNQLHQILILLSGLKYLNLNQSKLESKNTEMLGGLIYLKQLNLQKNNIGQQGLYFLMKLRQLENLNLADNQIKLKNPLPIKNLIELKFFNLNGNHIGHQGVKQFIYLKNIIQLSLNGNSIGQQGIKIISNLTQIIKLDLSCNSIDQNGAKYLLKLKKLQQLKIMGNKLLSEGMKVISEMKNLKWLDISYNNIDNVGAFYIGNMSKLNYLNIEYNNIKDDGVKQIAKLTKLKFLNLQNTNITQQGIIHLSKLKSLIQLNLNKNDVKNGTKIIVQLRNLEKLNLYGFWLEYQVNKSIHEISALDLSSKNLKPDQIIGISNIFVNITSLNLFQNCIDQDVVKAIRSNLPKLMKLNLFGFWLQDKNTIYQITTLNLQYRKEDVDYKNPNPYQIKLLLQILNNLTKLNLNGHKIQKNLRDAVLQHPTLKQINLFGIWFMDILLKKPFNQITMLEFKQDIDKKKLIQNNIDVIVNIFPKLTTLNLSKIQIDQKGAQMISQLKNLQFLNLSNCSINNNKLAQIANLQNLQILNVSQNNIKDEGAKMLKKLNNLTSLNLSKNEITFQGIRNISTLFKLTQINLSFINVSQSIKYVINLKNLITLNLQCTKVDLQGVKLITTLIHIRSLNLKENNLSNEGAKIVSGIKNLEYLNLAKNDIKVEGVKQLTNLKNLKEIDLRQNGLSKKFFNQIQVKNWRNSIALFDF